MLPLLPLLLLAGGTASLGVGVYETTHKSKRPASPPANAPAAPGAPTAPSVPQGASTPDLNQGVPAELSAAAQALMQFGQDPSAMERLSVTLSQDYGYADLGQQLWDRAGELRDAQERTARPATQAAAPAYTYDMLPSGYPVLRMGSASDAVKSWQQFLNYQQNAGLTVDGKFGQNTYNATVAFQKAAGLAADGAVGQQTIAAAQKALGVVPLSSISGEPVVRVIGALPKLQRPVPTDTATATATVTGTGVRLRSKPGLLSHLLGHVSAPESVQLLGERGKWARVQTAAGLVGYVHKKYLRMNAPLPPAVTKDDAAMSVGATNQQPRLARCVAPSGCRLRNSPSPTSSFKALVGNGEQVLVLKSITGPKAERVSPGAGGWSLVNYNRLAGWLPTEWLR